MSGKFNLRLARSVIFLVFLGLVGCSGDDGDDGRDGRDGVDGVDGQDAVLDSLEVALKDVEPESCLICHADSGSIALSGANHQEEYEEFYQDQVLRVINLAYTFDGANDIVTFEMTKKDESGVEQNFDCTLATTNPEPDLSDALSINFVEYDPATREFSDGAASSFWRSIKGTLTYDPNTNECQSTKAQTGLGDLSLLNGHIAVYGRDETLFEDPLKHISSAKFPFATILKFNTADYASKARSSACENCHTRPFLKHTYVYGEVNDGSNNDGNDFYVCKTCHLDEFDGFGALLEAQTLADLKHLLAEAQEAGDTVAEEAYKQRIDEIVEGGALTAEEQAKYAYKTKLMNNVHISHSMEFGFPQSMRNCATCHEGDQLTADNMDNTIHADYFLPETCISCHAIDGLVAKMTTNRAGNAITVHNAFIGDSAVLRGIRCHACHSPPGYIAPDGTDYTGTAGAAVQFADIHTGYDPEIYTDDGTKYSEAITVSIDSASFDAATNVLTVNFSASEGIPIDPYNPEDIFPMLLVGPYGYDTKHYIVYPHGRDENRERLLEYELDGIADSDHPRITEVDTGDPTTWQAEVDMSMWADMIADGAIRRLEIGVMPRLGHATLTVLDRRGNTVPLTLAMNAPSRAFDITVLPNGMFLNEYPDVADGVEDDVVDVLNGCNSCHDALATTFHSAQRGGNIKICKMCHVPSAAGSHLEMQSRSIDSYVHAVHSFQGFDFGDIDFSDPEEAAEHQHTLSAEFPRFGVKNCESCHLPGKYGVPDQSKSLPSLHAGNDVNNTTDRNIGTVPRYVMGPAARACGACHRAQMIKDDDANKLAAFNEHVRTFGYLVEDEEGAWEAVVDKVMSFFYQ